LFTDLQVENQSTGVITFPQKAATITKEELKDMINFCSLRKFRSLKKRKSESPKVA